ncbi:MULTISPECIES: hypothetical protein [Calditerrivibrio]|uniref:hypothetical protein n=1 Tax=Calditerrivibrio TaxID=545865 RepID=UPI003C75F7E2
MSKCHWVRYFLVSVSLLILLFLEGCANSNDKQLKLVKQKCGVCHPVELVFNKKRDIDEWNRVIHGMKVRGLKLTEKEENEIVGYLTKNYGK